MAITTCRICQRMLECAEDEASRPLHACGPLDRVCPVCAVRDGDTWAAIIRRRNRTMARVRRTMKERGPER